MHDKMWPVQIILNARWLKIQQRFIESQETDYYGPRLVTDFLGISKQL